MNSSTEDGELCVNGMSYNARNGVNSNAAVVCQVSPQLWNNDVLSGIEYQRAFEKKAFEAGGSSFLAPAQSFGDFIDGSITDKFTDVKPTIKPGTKMADINSILGSEISDAIKSAINYWDRVIDGYAMKSAVLTAIESRTSSLSG